MNDIPNQLPGQSEYENFNLDDPQEEDLIDLEEGLDILNEGFHYEASDDESGVPIFPFELSNNATDVSGPLAAHLNIVSSAAPVIGGIVYDNGDEISAISVDDMGMDLDNWDMDDPTIDDPLIL